MVHCARSLSKLETPVEQSSPPDTSSIKDSMRLLLLKYSNLVENKSPPRRFVGVIYLKLGNKNASDLHRGGEIEYLQGMKDMRRNSPRCHFGRVMLSRSRS